MRSSFGLGPLLLRELGGVRVQLHRRVLRHLLGDAVLGVVGPDHAVAPVEQLVAVLLRDAHEVGDHLERELGRDVDDEVALAALGHPVDDVGGALAHRRLELADHPRREALVDEPAVAGVQRRVHVEHEQPLLLEVRLVGVPHEHEPLRRGEASRCRG